MDKRRPNTPEESTKEGSAGRAEECQALDLIPGSSL